MSHHPGAGTVRVGDEVSLGLKRIIHVNGRFYFDRFAVEQCGCVAPLADGLDSGTSEIRINLSIHDAERERFAILADDGVEDDSALHACRPGGLRIDGPDLRNDFGGLYGSANAEAGRFA